MKPVWIINLAGDKAATSHFTRLLSGLTAVQNSYWQYTEIRCEPLKDNTTCKALWDELLNEGRTCYNTFQQKGFAIRNFQVCIIGSIEEERSRSCFHLVPCLLKEVWKLISMDYVMQGMECTGLLYMPHNLVQLPAEVRRSCASFLEEFNALEQELKGGHFNRVVVFQPVQRPDVKFYPELNPQQRVELLFQYLLSIYYSGDAYKGLFDQLTDPGVYAIGAASVYYNNRSHKEQVAHLLLERLIDCFTDETHVSTEEVKDMADSLFPLFTINAEALLDRLQENCQGLNVDLITLEGKPALHPVFDFHHPRLYISYYLDYLRYMPARALEFTRLFARMFGKRLFGQIRSNSGQLLAAFSKLLAGYNTIYEDRTYTHTTLTQLKATLNEVRKRFKHVREKISEQAPSENREVFSIPDYLADYYRTFKADSSTTIEKELAEDLAKSLKTEPTVMGLLTRCFLLGTVMIFTLIPILRELSPFIIDLGDVANYEYVWIGVVFLFPFIWHFGIRLRRHFNYVRKQKKMLLAHALINVQEKTSVFLYTEALNVCDEMIRKCEQAISQVETIEDSLKVPPMEKAPADVPETLFNQSLIGGSFNGKHLLAENALSNDGVDVHGYTRLLTSLTPADYLALLNRLFKTPGNCPVCVTEQDEASLHSWLKQTLQQLKNQVIELIKISKEESVTKIINELQSADLSRVDLSPLFRMAGVNGMITHNTDESGLLIRSCSPLEHLPNEAAMAGKLYNDPEIETILFINTWSHPENGLLTPVSTLCGTASDRNPSDVSYSCLLTCLFAYNDRTHYFKIGDLRIMVSQEQMNGLVTFINTMRS